MIKKVVCIFGDGAVGKMSVGQELKKLTGFKLLHNHLTIEPVLSAFEEFRLDTILKLRALMIDELIIDKCPGFITTFMWALDDPEDALLIEADYQKFLAHDLEVYFVELDASLETRLKRNRSANRLAHKPSKRDLAASDKRVIDDSQKHRFISYDGEIKYPNFLRIINDNISALEAAQIIKDHFHF